MLCMNCDIIVGRPIILIELSRGWFKVATHSSEKLSFITVLAVIPTCLTHTYIFFSVPFLTDPWRKCAHLPYMRTIYFIRYCDTMLNVRSNIISHYLKTSYSWAGPSSAKLGLSRLNWLVVGWIGNKATYMTRTSWESIPIDIQDGLNV